MTKKNTQEARARKALLLKQITRAEYRRITGTGGVRDMEIVGGELWADCYDTHYWKPIRVLKTGTTHA